MSGTFSTPPIRGPWRTDPRARAAYAEGAGIYRIVPSAVAIPANAADVAALVRWAGETGTPLTARGAGSAMGGGNVGTGVIVDLTALEPRVCEIDPIGRRARTSANVSLAELEAAAAAHGLRLPPDPSSGKWATLGGMVATNAAGPRTVRYGSVRSWVQGLELVDGTGETLALARDLAPPARFRPLLTRLQADRHEIHLRFPRTRKNSAGYALDAAVASGDLLDLVIGAEGTLGLVTAVTWRLDRVPTHRAALRVVLDDLDALSETILALHAVDPSAVELLERSFLDLVAARLAPGLAGELAGAAAVLLVDLERDDAEDLARAVHDARRGVAQHVRAVAVARDAHEAHELWALRHAASPILAGLPEARRSLQVIEDGCVPLRRLADYVRAVRAATARHRVDAVLFGHAGDGHLHVNLLPRLDEPDWRDRVAAIFAEVSDAQLALGGTPSGEHGVGRLRAGLLERLYGPELIACMREVKAAFDPHGILNPGIILSSAEAPVLTHLKVGADAAPLPPDIAHGLRTIEREGGYAAPRLALADTPSAAARH